jgi:hypothetical protein
MGVGAGLLLLLLEALVGGSAPGDFYIQQWSSETMMQTVSVLDLQRDPWGSISEIHIQPPLFDALRALLAWQSGEQDPLLLVRDVDRAVYGCWIVAYGLMALLLVNWLAELTSQRYAVIAVLIFLVHPPTLFYASMLDTTFVSSLLILWMYCLLWRQWRSGSRDFPWMLVLAVVLLFFTRSVFQWPWILLMGLSLWLMGLSRRHTLVFLLLAGGLSGIYLGKQYTQFGILSTSSFSGSNLINSVGEGDTGAYWSHLSGQDAGQPGVLTRTRKQTGAPNFNHSRYLELNSELLEKYRAHLSDTPVADLLRNYWKNMRIWWQPSSVYTQHKLVDRVPWRGWMDRLFSAPVLPGMLLLAGAVWWLGRGRDGPACDEKSADSGAGFLTRWMPLVGFLLPGLFVFAVTVLFEQGENMRLKYLLEPLFFVFLASQLYRLIELSLRRGFRGV